MRGKAGLVIGLAAGYVLGTRAGRERYEQIKTQAEKVWNLPPVQKQVDKLQALGTSALPRGGRGRRRRRCRRDDGRGCGEDREEGDLGAEHDRQAHLDHEAHHGREVR